jgi:hypothetical protein
MKKSLLKAVAFIGLGFGTTLANPNSQPMPTAPNQGQNLQKVIDIESYSHQERIRILQEADQCIHNAKTKEEYRACEEKEKQEREQLKQKVFEMRKQNLLNELSNHPNVPQSIKDCVANATNHEQLKACHEQLKTLRQQFKQDKIH